MPSVSRRRGKAYFYSGLWLGSQLSVRGTLKINLKKLKLLNRNKLLYLFISVFWCGSESRSQLHITPDPSKLRPNRRHCTRVWYTYIFTSVVSLFCCTLCSIKITFFVEQCVKVFIICICIKFSVDYSV